MLEKYGGRVYPLMAPHLFNSPAELIALSRAKHSVASHVAPPTRSLRDAKLETLERWLSQAEPLELKHTAGQITLSHIAPAGRLLRHADMLVASAVLQLPLDAIRAFHQKFRGLGWKR